MYIGQTSAGPGRSDRKILDMRARRRRRPYPMFSGRVYLAGRLFDGMNSDGTKPWVKVDVAFGNVSQEEGPPPNPFPTNEEWYEKVNTFGDIHVPRFG